MENVTSTMTDIVKIHKRSKKMSIIVIFARRTL